MEKNKKAQINSSMMRRVKTLTLITKSSLIQRRSRTAKCSQRLRKVNRNILKPRNNRKRRRKRSLLSWMNLVKSLCFQMKVARLRPVVVTDLEKGTTVSHKILD